MFLRRVSAWRSAWDRFPESAGRFLVDGAGAGESAIDVQTGEAVLMSGNAELRLRTHVGLAVIAPGARILFGRNGEAIDYSVEVGEARFRDREGNEVVLRAGESLQVEIGMAALKRRGAAGGRRCVRRVDAGRQW